MSNHTPTPNKFGRRVIFARGMSCDVESPHAEWIDELQRRASAHDELVAALELIASGLESDGRTWDGMTKATAAKKARSALAKLQA